MAIFNASCYIALGTGAPGGVLTELTGGTYARKALSLVGSFASGGTQSVAQFNAATGPLTSALAYTPTKIKSGAIFDAATGGNQLCYWNWPIASARTAITTAFPATVIDVAMVGNLRASANTFNGVIMPGEQIGTLNGSPMIASSNLAIDSGVLVAAPSAPATDLTIGYFVAYVASIAGQPSYANDTAAAAGGVPLGAMYRNGSLIQVRVS